MNYFAVLVFTWGRPTILGLLSMAWWAALLELYCPVEILSHTHTVVTNLWTLVLDNVVWVVWVCKRDCVDPAGADVCWNSSLLKRTSARQDNIIHTHTHTPLFDLRLPLLVRTCPHVDTLDLGLIRSYQQLQVVWDLNSESRKSQTCKHMI